KSEGAVCELTWRWHLGAASKPKVSAARIQRPAQAFLFLRFSVPKEQASTTSQRKGVESALKKWCVQSRSTRSQTRVERKVAGQMTVQELAARLPAILAGLRTSSSSTSGNANVNANVMATSDLLQVESRAVIYHLVENERKEED
ncbi:unnamed protein product, partial [Amoebophrya sp. A25]